MTQRPYTRLRSEDGFTLATLLATIVILALLALVTIPAYAALRDRAHTNHPRVNVSTTPALTRH